MLEIYSYPKLKKQYMKIVYKIYKITMLIFVFNIY